jgi:D-alanyl-D-alanine carboxypeptidase
MLRSALALILGVASSGSGAATPPSDAQIAASGRELLVQNYPADGPGAALLVARGDQLILREARGLASVELNVPLSPDHVFRIGSISKQFAAAGLLKLVEAGKVSLDDALIKYVPDYPNGAAITVRQLLNHTSGVKSYTGIAGLMDGPIRNDVSTAQLIATFRDLPVDFAPGEAWAYNNSGYVLLGAVIESASGKAWHAWLDESLFAPLTLSSTRYGADDALIPGHARGYDLDGTRVMPMRQLSMTQPHAAGALVSTLDDLWRWNRALHEGRVVRPETHAQMTTPVGKAIDSGYGFGIVRTTVRGTTAFDHGGGIFGFATYLMYLPDSELSIVLLQNLGGVRDGTLEPEQLVRKLAAFAIGNPYPAAVAIAMAPAALASMQGVYRIDAQTTRVLRVVDGKLTSQRTGGDRFALLPIAADEFLFDDGFTRLRIERGADGAVSGARLFPNGEGEGQLALLTGDALPQERTPMTLPATARERVVGAYSAGPMQLRVFADGEQLKAQLTGQPAFEIFAETESRFYLTVVDAQLVFAPDSGPVESVTLLQNGAETVFTRSPAHE